jgi:hypothetical protein
MVEILVLPSDKHFAVRFSVREIFPAFSESDISAASSYLSENSISNRNHGTNYKRGVIEFGSRRVELFFHTEWLIVLGIPQSGGCHNGLGNLDVARWP